MVWQGRVGDRSPYANFQTLFVRYFSFQRPPRLRVVFSLYRVNRTESRIEENALS